MYREQDNASPPEAFAGLPDSMDAGGIKIRWRRGCGKHTDGVVSPRVEVWGAGGRKERGEGVLLPQRGAGKG